MKVTIYDDKGEVIGIAWHENSHGYIELDPATRECLAASFSVNDGPVQALSYPVRVPVDEQLRLRIRDLNAKAKTQSEDYFERLMREAFRGEDLVDKPATPVTWWGKMKRFLMGDW